MYVLIHSSSLYLLLFSCTVGVGCYTEVTIDRGQYLSANNALQTSPVSTFSAIFLPKESADLLMAQIMKRSMSHPPYISPS